MSAVEAVPTVLEVTLGDVANGGTMVARHGGRVVFVSHGAPGERVKVALRQAKAKDRFWRGDVVEVIEASEHRVGHPWRLADALARGPEAVPGGAEFGHLDLAFQRELKARVLAEQLRRLAGIEEVDGSPVVVEPAIEESADGLGWRTRAAFGVDKGGHLSMRAARSHRLVRTPTMPLAVPAIDALGLADVDLSGLERVEVAAPSTGDGPLVLAVQRDGSRGSLRAPQRLADALGRRAWVSALTQAEGAAADGSGSLRRVSGRTWVSEEADGRLLRVSGEGFWQVHRSAPATLLGAVTECAQVKEGERWADLYAGAGLFSATLARAVGESGSLLSIEGAPGTHKDARRNLHELPQATVIQGRVERALGEAVGAGGLDGVVLDPPRAGAGPEAVAAIASTGAARVVYVSCDPATFSRDAADFARHGYELGRLRAFDLYPHTHHVEMVGLLTRSHTGE